MKTLGHINTEKTWNWIRTLKFEPETWNGKVNQSGRKVVWFGLEVELGFNSKIKNGNPIYPGLDLACKKYYPDYNSVLVIKYEPGVELKPHTDRSCFDKKVVVINLSQDNLFNYGCEFIYENVIYKLKDGDVIEFDSSKAHGIKPVENLRYSISIRKVI